MGNIPVVDINDIEVAKVLYDEFCVGKTMRLEYGELSKKVYEKTGIDIDPHYGLKPILVKMIEICIFLGLPLLSAKIVDKKSQFPSGGFRKEAVRVGYRPEYANMTDRDAARNEWTLIRECKDWASFAKFINGIPLTEIEPIKFESLEKTEHNDNVSNFDQTETLHEDTVTDVSLKVEQVQLYIEGELETVTYENRSRNENARKKCIELNGSTCIICKSNLGDIYGEQFSDKIHIHHLNPVADYEGEVLVNPQTDLVPVCPNCHFIIHSKKTPYKPDEVIAFIESKTTKQGI